VQVSICGAGGEQVVLGIKWFSENDVIRCCKPTFDKDEELTKRSLLSLVGRVYDYLGLLSGPVLFLKLILQNWHGVMFCQKYDKSKCFAGLPTSI